MSISLRDFLSLLIIGMNTYLMSVSSGQKDDLAPGVRAYMRALLILILEYESLVLI